MPTAKVYDLQGQAAGEQELNGNVFAAPVNTAVLYQVVQAQMVNRRQGNASTLTRSEVSGGNKKPYRQKGTGHARQGSNRAPHFRHGGTVFGPHPHVYQHKVLRQHRRIAIRSALSDKVNSEKLFILKDFVLDAPKTRTMLDFFANLELTSDHHAHPSVLILWDNRDENLLYSARNIRYVKFGHVSSINVIELMKHDYVMLSPEAVAYIEETFDDGEIISDDEANEEI